MQDGDYRRRVINEEQAEIVREIFERYDAGEGAKAIARDLNERGVPSPGAAWRNRTRRAAGWMNSTITGAYTKANGILRNPIYKGAATWNRLASKKKPGTGKRVQKRRPEEQWLVTQDESLRIVSDEVWNRVQRRLDAQ